MVLTQRQDHTYLSVQTGSSAHPACDRCTRWLKDGSCIKGGSFNSHHTHQLQQFTGVAINSPGWWAGDVQPLEVLVGTVHITEEGPREGDQQVTADLKERYTFT